MCSIVGFILGGVCCLPVIEELTIVYDGAVIARAQGSQKTQIIGQYADLSAKLSMLELMTAEAMFAPKIGYWFESIT